MRVVKISPVSSNLFHLTITIIIKSFSLHYVKKGILGSWCSVSLSIALHAQAVFLFLVEVRKPLSYQHPWLHIHQLNIYMVFALFLSMWLSRASHWLSILFLPSSELSHYYSGTFALSDHLENLLNLVLA